MNDIVFAGSFSDYEKQEQKFNKCLKIICRGADAPESAHVNYGGCDSAEVAYGGCAIIPPYAYHSLCGFGDKDAAVCIEQPLIPNNLPVNVIDGGACEGLIRAADEAVLRFGGRSGGAVLSALGQLIVAYVCEDYPERLHPVTKMLKAEIEKNFADSAFSADAAIAKLPLNRDYVRKLFKKEVGVTPHDFLNGLRMQRARALILSGISNSYSHYTVSQIAEACGFAEPLYFSRAFKKFFGASPMQYAENAAASDKT